MFPQPAFVGSRFVFQWFNGLQSCSIEIHSLAASIAQRRLEGREGVTKATIPVDPSSCRAPLVDGRRGEQLPCVPEMALDKGKLCTGRVACCLWVALLARGFPLSNVARHGLTDGGGLSGTGHTGRKLCSTQEVTPAWWCRHGKGLLLLLSSSSSDRLVSHVMDVGCCSLVSAEG